MPASAGRSVERIYYTVQHGRKTPQYTAVSVNDGGNTLVTIERFFRTDVCKRLAYPYTRVHEQRESQGHMKQWVALGKFLAGHMQVIVPICVALGVLFPQQIGVLKPIVPTLFAFMTFQGALSNTFHQVTEVFRRPLHLVLALLVSAVLIPIAAYAMGSLFFGELHPISWTLKLRFEKREASEMPRRKKARYGREMRARAADLFEAGLGFELAAKKLDVPAPAVRKWLYAYRATGRKGLIGMGESRRTYDMETKLAVARAVVDEGMPRSEAMARFGIAAATSLDRWCRLYREGGPEALEPGRRGRPEGPGGRTRERELEERVRKLEAQVAYLKKSIALKAEKSSQTGRKPRS